MRAERKPRRRPTRSRSVRWWISAGVLVLAACAGEDGTAPKPPHLVLEALTTEVAAVPGYRKQVRARVRDDVDEAAPGISVSFTVAPGHGSVGGSHGALDRTGADGVAAATWRLPEGEGAYELTVTAEDAGRDGGRIEGSPAVVPATVESFGPVLDRMLWELPDRIAGALTRNRDLFALNPGLEEYLEEKIGVLERDDLDAEIIAEGRFAESEAPSVDGREIPVVAVFVLETMRPGALRSVGLVSRGLAVLEPFMELPFPAGTIDIWYGFSLASFGGGGSLHLEDRGTYQRRQAGELPHDGIVLHELSHSYISHESMTQFLERLALNVIRHGSTEPDAWSHTRGYDGPSASNTGVHALLDIYRSIGYGGMARAYRTIRTLHPRYGEALSTEAQQAFVDEAPEELRDQVAASASRIGV